LREPACEDRLVDSAPAESITEWLQAWAAGDREAEHWLFDLVYPELKRLARRQLARERGRITLGATDLVNEAYLRLAAQRDWQNRHHFFALAATLLRWILVDHAKQGGRQKRGRGAVHLVFDETLLPGAPPDLDLLALDEALVALARVRTLAARIVELRFFAGLSVEEAAMALGVSRATVLRQWRFARAWLARTLGAEAG
jgi:RNA polymerase sigma factor (TIGR02999 family)